MLKKMLCSEVDNNIQRWPDFLPYLQQGYNVSIHETTTCTPNRLMFGAENRLPVDTVFVEGIREELVPQCHYEYDEWVRNASQEAFSKPRDNLNTQTG